MMRLIEEDMIVGIGIYMCIAGVFLLINGILLILLGDMI